MWCVIPAAGRATRMGERTADRPKPLLPVGPAQGPAGTLLGRILNDIHRFTVSACIVVTPGENKIRTMFGDRHAGIELHYVVQERRAGVGHAVCRAREVVDGPFAAIMGDAYYDNSVAQHLKEWTKSISPGAVLVEPLGEPSGEPMGLVRVEDGRVRDVRKGADPAGWTHRVSGMFMLPPEAFETCDELDASSTGEIEVEAIVRALLDRGIRFEAIPYTGFRLNVNTPEELDQVREMAGGGSPG